MRCPSLCTPHLTCSPPVGPSSYVFVVLLAYSVCRRLIRRKRRRRFLQGTRRVFQRTSLLASRRGSRHLKRSTASRARSASGKDAVRRAAAVSRCGVARSCGAQLLGAGLAARWCSCARATASCARATRQRTRALAPSVLAHDLAAAGVSSFRDAHPPTVCARSSFASSVAR